MKKIKVIISDLLIVLLTALIIITLYIKTSQSNEKNALDSSEFEWSEVFDQSDEISKEDKYKMYADALESTLETAILDGFKELKDTSVEIDQTDQVTKVTIKLNIDLETKFDEKDIDRIYNLVLGSIRDISKENISIINQNGEKINLLCIT